MEPGSKTTTSAPDWPGNWPERTAEVVEIAEQGCFGNEADYDRAHAELMSRGFTSHAAQHMILSADW